MLLQAFLGSREDIALELIKAGAAEADDKDRVVWEESALHSAARKGWSKACRELLARGAGLEKRDSSGWTALHVACFHARPDCVDELSKYGGLDVENDAGETCVEVLTRAERADGERVWRCLSTLLEAGCDLSKRAGQVVSRSMGEGDLAFAFSAWGGEPREKCALACMEHGSTGAGTGKSGAGALHYAAGAAMPELCRALVQAGASADGLDSKGMAPLHWLCLSRGPDAVSALGVLEVLASGGADLALPDKYGYGPFAQAMGADNAGVVEALAAMGLDPRAPCEPDGRDAYAVAVSSRRPEMAEALDRGRARWEAAELEAGAGYGARSASLRM
jgi:ankyrin repeat protein